MASYNERVQDLNNITQERDDIKRQYDELRKRRHEKFYCRTFVFVTFTQQLSFLFRRMFVPGWMSSWQDST